MLHLFLLLQVLSQLVPPEPYARTRPNDGPCSDGEGQDRRAAHSHAGCRREPRTGSYTADLERNSVKSWYMELM